MDCADAAITSLIRAAAKLQYPLRLKVWDAKNGGYVYIKYKDFSTVEQFEQRARLLMGAINLIDITVKQKWIDLVPGDLMLYDLRSHNDPRYNGHTMIITRRDDSVKKWTTIEGHLAIPLNSSQYTQQEFLDYGGGRWNGPVEGMGRYWDWNDLITDE